MEILNVSVHDFEEIKFCTQH